MEKASNSLSTRRVLRRSGRAPFLFLGLFAALLYLQFLYFPSRIFEQSASQIKLSEHRLKILEEGLAQCASDSFRPVQYEVPPLAQRANPRWNPKSGQSNPLIIINATLFDGTSFQEDPANIFVNQGVITSVSFGAINANTLDPEIKVIETAGQYVTPGLVDMHSHHIGSAWPELYATEDGNEINPDTGPLSPMVRALDAMKAYDIAATLIASGGITSSLILPGSANIMGGEAYPVKNLLRSGLSGEEVVEELLLEHSIPQRERRRYMKMACGENPKRVYDHTRMGNAWKLREQMAKGKDLMRRQDAWCLSAEVARDSGDVAEIASLTGASESRGGGGYPKDLALDSTIAMLRGQVNVNIHCYEPEDFEDMLRHNDEFGFTIAAFHHAIEAWKVPELIKSTGTNITIATFQDFAFYKHEAYDANLHAGKILAEHGVPVAYKSDHFEEDTNAKYLLFQAAGAHSFGLPADLALQAVTSVPARSIGQDHRIGFVKPGYDADIVLWDSHPLSIGATPAMVFVDGKYALPDYEPRADPTVTQNTSAKNTREPQMRPMLENEERDKFCQTARNTKNRFIITGVKKSFIESSNLSQSTSSSDSEESMTMILEAGKVVCLGSSEDCVHDKSMDTIISLKNGHVLPGLTGVSGDLGLVEIAGEEATADGLLLGPKDIFNPASVVYAKYGIHLEGKGFKRAGIGGVTRVITSPLSYDTLLRGVSVGFKTTGNNTILDGGIFQDDVALHFVLGQQAKGLTNTQSTISGAVGKLRRILFENKGKDSIYGRAADGDIPVVVHAVNKYDIMQLIRLKKEHGTVNLIVMQGHEAPLVAKELADAQIPVIFTAHRGAPASWEKKDMLVGPPLTKSGASVLAENGVKFAIAIAGDST